MPSLHAGDNSGSSNIKSKLWAQCVCVCVFLCSSGFLRT